MLPLLTAAVWTDFKSGTVSNRMIVLGLLLGLSYQMKINGLSGILYFLVNISIPVIMFYLLFLMHALGAGDIKLLSMTGSFLTVSGSFHVIAGTFLFAAFFSLCKLLWYGNLWKRLFLFKDYVEHCMKDGRLYVYPEAGAWNQKLHFSVAVFAGTIFYLGVNYCVKS